MNYTSTLKQLVDLEDAAFIDTDASMHKATQENGEFQEALLWSDIDHIVDEAADAVTNTLIATFRVIWEVPEEKDFFSSKDIVNTTISYARLNDALQTYRGIYTRNTKSITKEEVLEKTRDCVAWILNQVNQIDPSVTVASLVEHSLGKITQRMATYKPQIDLKDIITSYDFKWVDFKDISPLLANPEYADYIDKQFKFRTRDADVIVWLDARGFLWRNIATDTGKPFVMMRKPGKLPWELISTDYEKEYWIDTLCLQKNAIKPWQKVAIIDDALATSGTAGAAWKNIEAAWGIVEWYYFLMELLGLQWREKLSSRVKSMVKF